MNRTKLCSLITTVMLSLFLTVTIFPPEAMALGSKFPRPDSNPTPTAPTTPITADYTIDSLQDGKIIKIDSNGIYHQRFTEEPVSKGITNFRFERFDQMGWVRGNVLVVDLKDTNVRTDLLFPGTLSSKQTLSSMVKNSGAIAGINGDFFDIGKTNAPLGVTIKDNNIIKSAHTWNQSVGVTNDGLGMISRIMLSGVLTNMTRDVLPIQLHGINEVSPKLDEIVLYNTLWGQASRASLVGTGIRFTEVVIKDNTVIEVINDKLYTQKLDANTVVLLGRGSAADRLVATFNVGDKIDISYTTNPDFKNLRFALSGDVLVVDNGQPVSQPSNPYTHPRTAVGFDKSNSKMYMAVIDGRYSGSRGMTYDELGIFMASLGAWNAINLDSGGSSELVARPLAQTSPIIANRLSEGSERLIPNGIGFWSTAPVGSLGGFKLKPLQDKVLQGFTRTITANPYDQFLNPMVINNNP
ncbi:MAG: phosphodiester glycosidase family protein, partial [Firmicutes bacterium]|nr:phosphodiester glycosidase family protein [Bacillota bacterium]